MVETILLFKCVSIRACVAKTFHHFKVYVHVDVYDVLI